MIPLPRRALLPVSSALQRAPSDRAYFAHHPVAHVLHLDCHLHLLQFLQLSTRSRSAFHDEAELRLFLSIISSPPFPPPLFSSAEPLFLGRPALPQCLHQRGLQSMTTGIFERYRRENTHELSRTHRPPTVITGCCQHDRLHEHQRWRPAKPDPDQGIGLALFHARGRVAFGSLTVVPVFELLVEVEHRLKKLQLSLRYSLTKRSVYQDRSPRPFAASSPCRFCHLFVQVRLK